MKQRSGVRELGSAYSSYQGKVHDRDANVKTDMFGDVRVSMNSVSDGHVVFGKPAATLREERERLWKVLRAR